MAQECAELLNFTFLLLVFRPRKQWPDFFGLGINGFEMQGNQNGQPNEVQRQLNIA